MANFRLDLKIGAIGREYRWKGKDGCNYVTIFINEKKEPMFDYTHSALLVDPDEVNPKKYVGNAKNLGTLNQIRKRAAKAKAKAEAEVKTKNTDTPKWPQVNNNHLLK